VIPQSVEDVDFVYTTTPPHHSTTRHTVLLVSDLPITIQQGIPQKKTKMTVTVLLEGENDIMMCQAILTHDT